MKLKVLSPLNEYENNAGVSVYSIQTIELPLHYVVKKCFIDFDNRRPFKVDVSEEVDFFRSHDEKFKLYQFSLKNKKNICGFILYNDTKSVAEFILKNYIPSGNYKLDLIIKDISCLPKTRQKQILMESIIKEKKLFITEFLKNKRSLFYSADEYYNRLDFGPLCYEPHLVEKISQDSSLFAELNSNNRYILYRKIRRNKLCIVSNDEDHKKINIVKKMLIHPADSSVYFYYDGTTTQAILSDKKSDERNLLSFLPKEVYDEFDKYGTIIEIDREYLIPQEFRPLYLLRVPSYEEALQLLKNNKIYEKECKKVVRNFVRPLLVYDTRSNLKLQNNIKTINSVKTALAILSYITDWFYSPNNVSSTSNVYLFLEKKPYYLALGVIE